MARVEGVRRVVDDLRDHDVVAVVLGIRDSNNQTNEHNEERCGATAESFEAVLTLEAEAGLGAEEVHERHVVHKAALGFLFFFDFAHLLTINMGRFGICLLLMQLLLLLPALAALEYPLSFATLRQVELRRSPDELARLMGVPGPQGISISTNYQYVALDGWTFGKGLKGACHLWTNAEKYFGKLSRFGTTTSDIQSYLRKLYNQAGTKLLATAFSTYEFPVTERVDAKTAADKLALFVRTNNFDGAVL